MNQIPNIEEEIVNLREWWELQSIIDAIQTGRPIHKPDIDFLEKLAKSISKTLHHQLQKAREEERAKVQPIFQWLFGEIGDFPDVLEKPHYAFRKELRDKLKAIGYGAPEPFVPDPLPTQVTE